jgi:branched-subunit amino acid transport protein
MQKTVIVILGSALVSFLPRFLPMYYLTRQKIPPLVTAWLRYIPVAVLSALVVPGILTSDGRLFFSFENSYLLATIPAVITAVFSKNMVLTIIVGMAAVFLLQYFP